jgi:hypothetical protein
LTQTPLQSVSSVLQVGVVFFLHAPASHVSSDAQAFPHAPQWVGLVWVLTQVPLQSVSSVLQVGVVFFLHAPASHDSSDAQAFLHAPQWAGLVCGSTHAPSQASLGLGQTQVPAWQVWPLAQGLLSLHVSVGVVGSQATNVMNKHKKAKRRTS